VSRFVDPNDTTEVVVGPCECPDTPHSRDVATIRRQLGYAALGRIGLAALAEGQNGYIDPTATRRKLLEESITSWNFLGPDGEPVPVSAFAISELDQATVEFLAEKIDEQSRLREALPNGSGARSRGSSRASASRTRTSNRKSTKSYLASVDGPTAS
jgi:hypothetical protein